MDMKPMAIHNQGERKLSIEGTATSIPWTKSDGEATIVAVPKRASDSRPRALSATRTAATASAT